MAASKQVLAILAFLAIVLPTSVRATTYMVGDEAGWTLNFDYAAWAHGKKFMVGDTLVFKYPVGYHNVFKVGGPEFQACAVPLGIEPMASGYDVITLKTAGRKWYMCGKASGNHCKLGQKLVIDVLPASEAPAPAPWVSIWVDSPASPSKWDSQPENHHSGVVAPAPASEAPAPAPWVSIWVDSPASPSKWDSGGVAPAPASWSRKLL